MQPSYSLLPATSYPKTVGGVCYAIVGHSDSNKMLTSCYAYLMEISQHAQCRQAIPACTAKYALDKRGCRSPKQWTS